MKQRIVLALGLIAASLPAFAQTNVGVSVAVSQPGVYGRIDIGNVPQPPQVVYAQPVLVAPSPRVVVQPQPIYLYVPPGHQKHWSKHCGEYNACGQPVYFVKEDWYQQQYVPYLQARGEGPGEGHGKGRGHGKGHKD